MQEYVSVSKFTKINDRMFTHLEIVQDDCHDLDPRKDFDNVGTMVCFHSRYNLGDEDHGFVDSDWQRQLAMEIDDTVEERIDYWENGDGWTRCKNETEGFNQADALCNERVNTIIEKALGKAIILPLYLYDHSGLSMSTGGFSCPWDSGQVGFIYCTKETALKEWGNKILTKQVREKAINYLKGEVETYDKYLRGDIWGYRVKLYELDHDATFESLEEDLYDDTDWPDHASEVEEDSCWGFYGEEYCQEEGESIAKWYLENENKKEECRRWYLSMV